MNNERYENALKAVGLKRPSKTVASPVPELDDPTTEDGWIVNHREYLEQQERQREARRERLAKMTAEELAEYVRTYGNH
jgi:hypothetical protein